MGKAWILLVQGRLDEAIAEDEQTLALDPALVVAYGNMGSAYRLLGQFETSLEFIDKAIRLSPHDIDLSFWYTEEAGTHAALKQYDRAIEWARRAIAISPNNSWTHVYLRSSTTLPSPAPSGRSRRGRR